ncbi:MAG: S8 family serine peptidase [Bacteroidota bacterium]
MAPYIIKSGKGTLKLTKSTKLVGLKMNPAIAQTRGLEEPEQPKYVKREVHRDLAGFQVMQLDTEDATLDEKLDEVREKEEVDLGTHVYYAEGCGKPLIANGEIYITFEAGLNEEEKNIVFDEFALEILETINENEIIVKTTANSPNPVKTAALLTQSSLVKLADPDMDMPLDHYAFSMPVDPLMNHMWHLENRGYVADTFRPLRKGADARIVDAWRTLGNTGSANVTVALIDDGFDLSHPDLQRKVVKPFDFWTQSPRLYSNDPRYTHGTPCASVALAGGNGTGMVGAAPNAKFMPISGTSFDDRRTEQMFDYCIQNGADIISCSWGTTERAFQLGWRKERAISKAAREGRNGKGCIILFAAGNEDIEYLNIYAAHPDVIAVGASTSQDQHAFYSNRGRELAVVAPSNGDWPILAARAYWDQGDTRYFGDQKYWADGRSRGNKYKHFGGTSSSTPLVAGVCALILSANPDLTAREVKEILIQSSDKIGNRNEYYGGHSRRYGYGRVNAQKAVQEALRRRQNTTITQPQPQPQPNTGGSTGIGSGTNANTDLFRVDVEKQNNQGWGVQAGAYTDYNNVLRQSDQLKRMFNEPVIVASSVSQGRTIYRIILGNYPSLQQAQQLQSRMSQKGVNGIVRKLSDL